jgi:hypothetical protein
LEGQVICTVKYGDDLMLLAKEETLLQEKIDRLIGLRINNQQDASSIQNCIFSRNSTCFGHLQCPSSGVISFTRSSMFHAGYVTTA